MPKTRELHRAFLYALSIDAVKEEIAALDLEADATALQEAFLARKDKHSWQIATMQQTNAAIKLCLPLVGKPNSWVQFAHSYNFVAKYVRGMQWHPNDLNTSVKMCGGLYSLEIPFTLSDTKHAIVNVFTEQDFLPSCFYGTEDEEIWKRKIEVRRVQRMSRETIKVLDSRY